MTPNLRVEEGVSAALFSMQGECGLGRKPVVEQCAASERGADSPLALQCSVCGYTKLGRQLTMVMYSLLGRVERPQASGPASSIFRLHLYSLLAFQLLSVSQGIGNPSPGKQGRTSGACHKLSGTYYCTFCLYLPTSPQVTIFIYSQPSHWSLLHQCPPGCKLV